MLDSQAAAGKDQAHRLGGGQADGDAGGHGGTAAGRNGQRFVQQGVQIRPALPAVARSGRWARGSNF